MKDDTTIDSLSLFRRSSKLFKKISIYSNLWLNINNKNKYSLKLTVRIKAVSRIINSLLLNNFEIYLLKDKINEAICCYLSDKEKELFNDFIQLLNNNLIVYIKVLLENKAIMNKPEIIDRMAKKGAFSAELLANAFNSLAEKE